MQLFILTLIKSVPQYFKTIRTPLHIRVMQSVVNEYTKTGPDDTLTMYNAEYEQKLLLNWFFSRMNDDDFLQQRDFVNKYWLGEQQWKCEFARRYSENFTFRK